MTRIGIVHGGASYHLVTLADPRVARCGGKELYLPRLSAADLDGLDTVVVADRLHPGLLRDRASGLLGFAQAGGTLVVLGETEAHTWLPGLDWEPRPTNFWWWLTGEDLGVRSRHPEHPLWPHLGRRAVRWHYHGLLAPPPGATPLAVVEEEGREAGVVLYDDQVSTPGRIIVTTLDPVYHHGSNFMPGATEFLYGLLDWLSAPVPDGVTA
ncbi:MAG: hypothetical protein J2P26_05355 [Nocardiopsaceae bacterium]|nr:hypothetical protein [Nocardiopsaceae bacterium]